jgi:hypothetical protein
MKNLTKGTRHLVGANTDVVLPSGKPANVLAQDFSDFFVNKVEGIRNGIARTKSPQQTDNVVPEASSIERNFQTFQKSLKWKFQKLFAIRQTNPVNLTPFQHG